VKRVGQLQHKQAGPNHTTSELGKFVDIFLKAHGLKMNLKEFDE
jgi:hypothetical protein